MADFVPINPDILIWAREYHDLTKQELADKIKFHVNQIDNWESGKTKPTFKQAKKISSTLHIPFFYLLLSNPPVLETPLPDLRTRTDHALKVSPNFRDILYAVFDRFDWYKEYLEANDSVRRLAFVGSATINDNPLKVSSSIRNTLGINVNTRREVSTWSGYLKRLSRKAEAAGILVMRSSVVGKGTRRALSVDEFQGFVITDPYSPLIFINSRDFVVAQTFTLAHELAHVWVGASGILNADESEVPEPHADVESFCNSVAAELLVPAVELQPLWIAQHGSTAKLAEEFWVSEIVVLRRAYELQLISSDEFFPRLQALKKERGSKKGFGRSEHIERIATQHSEMFTDAVIKDTRSGGTLFRDAAELLSMTVPTFMGVIDGREM
jgi:Zn-dependent peptidase ImmA (M78 family)/DNA-binding XRE family transcriptional regulator